LNINGKWCSPFKKNEQMFKKKVFWTNPYSSLNEYDFLRNLVTLHSQNQSLPNFACYMKKIIQKVKIVFEIN